MTSSGSAIFSAGNGVQQKVSAGASASSESTRQPSPVTNAKLSVIPVTVTPNTVTPSMTTSPYISDDEDEDDDAPTDLHAEDVLKWWNQRSRYKESTQFEDDSVDDGIEVGKIWALCLIVFHGVSIDKSANCCSCTIRNTCAA